MSEKLQTNRFVQMSKSALLLLSLCLSFTSYAEERPNVLLILADDLGFSDLSCYGGEIATPNLDRLATSGARFSSFYTSARCCPSRASLMTGLHPHQTGIGSFTQSKQPPGKGLAYTGHLHPTCATLAEMLGDSGYSTWMVGKWHMAEPGPIERGFQNYFGYKNLYAHSEDQWDAGNYVRLPNGTVPELKGDGDFYATDVFTDYAIEFLQQAGEKKEQPWFLYLAHSSPHFPVQAPKESIDKHMATYLRGWDVLRAERFDRQKKLGLVSTEAKLPPLSQVPVDRDDIANGYSGVPNPEWETLPEERRMDLARRMATYAAMVEHVDSGVGRIIVQLEKSGELDNTLIAFLSDNGACYEWGPFGFDEGSRQGLTKLHTGAELDKMGQVGTHSSYGSGWANLCNTPMNMYKHFCHEGGIASTMFMHWPKGIEKKSAWIQTPSHLMDIVPTVLEATGATYPKERNETEITPVEGISLLPAIAGKDMSERSLAFEHQSARGLRKGDWKLVWGKRQPEEISWELYNLADDRSEQNNIILENSGKAKELIAEWETWAKRVGAEPYFIPEPGFEVDSPKIANREITIHATVKSPNPQGVVLAQGGREQGYALHFVNGVPTLDVRVNGKVTRLSAKDSVNGKIELKATITAADLTLTVNDSTSFTCKSPGLIPIQPKDDLSIGEDSLTAAGDYPDGNPFKGKVLSHTITTNAPSAAVSDDDRYYQRPEFELYRMDSGDKWEQKNLAQDPAFAETLSTLKNDLAAWMKSLGDTGRLYGKPCLLSEPESWDPDDFNSGKKPNILILVADDLGYGDTGFNGSKIAKTPNLDRFVKSGVNLTDFRACPMCSPTRAGLMTGRWPIRFGMMRAVVPPWSKAGLPASEETLPELLAGAGYERRGIVGKWHLGHTNYSQLPPQKGFNHFVGHYNGAIDYFTHEREDELDWHDGNETLREEGYSTDLIAGHASHFIEESPADKPWFLYVPFNAPHAPYQATEADLAVHANIDNKKRQTYAAMVTAMDRGIGQILAAVESRADADNTLILFFSDNGGILSVGSNAPYRGAKLSVYEGGTRVCAAIRWPAGGVKGGGSFDGRIGYIDVLPSALAAAGIQPGKSFDGVNFLPAVRGEVKLPQRPWFSYMHQNKSAASSVHLGKWKLITKGDAFTDEAEALELELYDLKADPGEGKNVAKDHPQRVSKMLARIREFGALQKPGVTLYGEGREGFVAPKDWKIEPVQSDK